MLIRCVLCGVAREEFAEVLFYQSIIFPSIRFIIFGNQNFEVDFHDYSYT